MKKHYTIDFNVPREKIKILPNWIDFNKFNKSKFNVFKIKKELNIKENQKVMLFVHRVVERKGAHFLVPIIFNLIEKNPNILLIVCGDGPYMQKLKLEIKKNNLEKYFLILGKVPNDEIPKYFAVSDLFLMPSLEEGFPHVLLESLAMNVPYVAADVGGVKEISPNILKGFVLDIVDLNLFSLNILNILDNLEILEFNYRNYVIKTFSFKEAQKIFLKNLEK